MKFNLFFSVTDNLIYLYPILRSAVYPDFPLLFHFVWCNIRILFVDLLFARPPLYLCPIPSLDQQFISFDVISWFESCTWLCFTLVLHSYSTSIKSFNEDKQYHIHSNAHDLGGSRYWQLYDVLSFYFLPYVVQTNVMTLVYFRDQHGLFYLYTFI